MLEFEFREQYREKVAEWIVEEDIEDETDNRQRITKEQSCKTCCR